MPYSPEEVELLETSLSLAESAAYLNISEGRQRDLFRQGAISNAHKVGASPDGSGGEWRTTVRSLEEYIAHKGVRAPSARGGTVVKVSGLTPQTKAALEAWASLNECTIGPAYYQQSPEAVARQKANKEAKRAETQAAMRAKGLRPQAGPVVEDDDD